MVLSGGANNGAWEAGIMWGFTHYGNADEYQWNTMSGISAGSINTAYMATFAPEESVEMTEKLSDLMTVGNTSDIWVNWPGGVSEGLLL